MEKINLNKLIKEAILKKKGISLSEYMKMCMTHQNTDITQNNTPLVSKEIS